MKKVTVPAVREEASYFCDKHPDRECFTKVMTMCWYGSQFDILNLQMNLCDECMAEFYKYVEAKFGVSPKEDESFLLGRCPLCHD